MHTFFESSDHFIIGDKYDELVSFGYLHDFALVAILGHIPLSFVEMRSQGSITFELEYFHGLEILNGVFCDDISFDGVSFWDYGSHHDSLAECF